MRTTAAVLALLLVAPAFAKAQEPVIEGEQMVHRVSTGETLSHIALEYLGSAHLWPEIYEANRWQIRDPHWIYPWNTLVIPGVDRPAVIREIRVDEERFPEVDFFTWEQRLHLSQRRPFQPMGVPEWGRQRTVFFGFGDREAMAPQVVVTPREAVTAFPRNVFHAAGWIATDPAEVFRLGEIRAFAGEQTGIRDRNTVHPYDFVRIRFDDGTVPEVGDHLLSYRMTRSIRGVGRIFVPSGRIEVRRVEAEGAIGQVVASSDRIQLGHYITRVRTFPLEPGVHAEETDERLEASIIAFQDVKEVYLPGDFAFIDRGERDGLKVGDELRGVVGDPDDWGEETVARFQVVGVRAGTSTVRVMHSENPGEVRPGLRLVLDRRMP